MSKKKIKLISVVIVLLMIFASCAKFPLSLYESTKLSVQAAKADGAEVFATVAYKLLTDSLDKAEIELVKDRDKWFRTYKASKRYLMGVNNLAHDLSLIHI